MGKKWGGFTSRYLFWKKMILLQSPPAISYTKLVQTQPSLYSLDSDPGNWFNEMKIAGCGISEARPSEALMLAPNGNGGIQGI